MTTVGTGIAVAEDGHTAAQDAVLEAVDGLDGATPDFAVVFCSSVYDYQTVVDTVREETDEATLVGSSSAGEFTEDGPAFESVTVSLIASDEMTFHVGLGEGLSDDLEGAVEAAAAELPDDLDEYPHQMGINVHDGLLGRGEEIAMLAYQHQPMPYTGGSAADDLQLEETVVFANDVVATDAVALAMIGSEKPFGQSVGHGHTEHAGPFEVTAADGSVIAELDGEPALEVWKNAVRDRAAELYDIDVDELTPEEDSFEELLTRFEFGIKTGEDEYKVRWPGLTPDTDGPMHFATKIPEGTELHVMDSDKERQVLAASTVSQAARDDGDASKESYAGALAFDCVCQAAILGDDFDDAVAAMADELGMPIAGMETYGEVSMGEGDMRAYHNTTSSVILLPE
jgi:methyl-accepting chemotaxis protein